MNDLKNLFLPGVSIDIREVSEAMNGDERQQRNLHLNRILVERGCRPEHYDIPRVYFYTEFDPKYWDMCDEIKAEERGSMIDDGEGE